MMERYSERPMFEYVFKNTLKALSVSSIEGGTKLSVEDEDGLLACAPNAEGAKEPGVAFRNLSPLMQIFVLPYYVSHQTHTNTHAPKHAHEHTCAHTNF